MKTSYAIAMAILTGVGGAAAVQTLHAQGKPPVYYVAEVEITNVDAYTQEYSPKAIALTKRMGGKVLAAGQGAVSIEGDPPKSRVVIQQWESMEKLKAWRNSPEYLENRKIGEKYAKFRAIAIEGVPQ